MRKSVASILVQGQLALVLSVLLSSSVSIAQTLATGKQQFDAGQYELAAGTFDAILDHGVTSDRPEAAAFLLRSERMRNRHDLVELRLAGCCSVAAETQFQGECHLEHGKSLQLVAKDVNAARTVYADILTSYPSNTFAASGALLQRGIIELENLQAASVAKATFDQVITNYAASPFADDALQQKVSACAALLDPQGMAAAIAQLKQQFPESTAVPAALLVEGNFANRTSGHTGLAATRYREIATSWPVSLAAATARLRLADMALKADYEGGIAEYQEILNDFPNMPKNLKDWARCQIGVYHYQLARPEQAQTYFQQVTSAEPAAAPNVLATANLHLVAIANPDSVEGLKALYDRGTRWRSQWGYRDLCWKEFQKFREKAESGGVFEQYCTNSSVPLGERAQMRYRYALVLFEVGEHDQCAEALGVLSTLLSQNSAPFDQRPYLEQVSYQECKYLEAFHHAHCGHFCHAAPIYRALLDSSMHSAGLVSNGYKELLRCLEADGDTLGAALACEEFLILYPYRAENQYFTRNRNRLLGDEPHQQAVFDKKKAEMLARITSKIETPVLLTEGPPPDKPKEPVAFAVPAKGRK